MTAYGERALEAELTALRAAGNGGRNEQLNRSAFSVGQLVAGGQLEAVAAKRALSDAAGEAGLHAREIATTLESGWGAGMADPRAPEAQSGERNGRHAHARRAPAREIASDMEAPRVRTQAARIEQRRVGEWEYRSADDETLYRKVRLQPGQGGRDKEFRYEHRDGAGAWKAGRGGDPVPYALPDLITAPANAIVFMAEGEAKADKLASWGLVATSHKDWQPEFGVYVTGRTVVILPDNDDAGAGYAEKARDALSGHAGRVVLLTLPGLPQSGDVLDWGGDAAELRALADVALNAPDETPETFPLADLVAWGGTDPEPRTWALDRLIPQGEVTLFTGPGGAGKSLFAQQLATCHAAALPMLGIPTSGGGALYITAEDDERELHWRQAHICRMLRRSLADLAGKLHLATLRGRLNNELATFDGEGRLCVAAAFTLLRDTIRATSARLVVLDNVAHLFAGNENDRGQVTAFANLLNALCRDLGVTVVLVGHPNKAGDSYSGSTAWLNAVRSQLTLKRPEDSHDPDARVLSLGKANYARQGETLAFRWHNFALILDSDLPDDRRAELAATIEASAGNSVFLACLAKATEEKRATSPNCTASNFAPRVFAAMTTGKGTTGATFTAAMERLLHLGTIRNGERVYQRDNRAWVTGLGLAPTLAPTPAPTMHEACTEANGVAGEVCTDLHALTPRTTYTGRGLDGPAPDADCTDDTGGIVWGDPDHGEGE